jgi:hypothetical protein
MTMTKEQTGAWVIHHAQKLNSIKEIPDYDAIKIAGKAGILLSAISASTEHTITSDKLKKLANASGITTLEIDPLLDILEKSALIECSKNNSEINVLGVTSHSILSHTTEIFKNRNPSTSEEAVLVLAEESSIQPQKEHNISKYLSDTFKISDKDIAGLLIDSRNIGFVDSESIGSENLFFNGHLFRRDTISKTNAVLDSLNPSEAKKLNELNEILENEGCVIVERAESILGISLYSKLISIGLFDASFISNECGRIGFLTKPSAFQKYGNPIVEDAFDLAKIFISALTYGMTKSSHSRGRITHLPALLNKLISGKNIGPVDAISKDYQLLEQKGVVHVFIGKNPDNGRQGYMMKLLKQEVGEIALSVLTKGSASEDFVLPSVMSNKPASHFEAPEQVRCFERKRTIDISPKATQELLRSLRTGEL